MDSVLHTVASRGLSDTEIAKSYDTSAYAATIFLIIFSSLVLIARIWSRLCANRERLWYDDFFVLAAWPFSMTFCVLLILQFDGETAVNAAAGHATFGANATFYMGMMLVKTSALFFYARVFKVKQRLMIWLWIIGVFNALVGLTFTFASSFYCIPARKVWDSKVPGTCGNITLIYLLGALLNAVTDIIILVIPAFPLAQLQVSKQRKYALIGVFLIGYGCPLLSIIKVGYVAHEYAGHSDTSKSDFIAPLVLTMCETPLAIITTCLPALFILVKHVNRFGAGSLFRSHDSSEARSLGIHDRSARSGSTVQPHLGTHPSHSSSGEEQTSFELLNVKRPNEETQVASGESYSIETHTRQWPRDATV